MRDPDGVESRRPTARRARQPLAIPGGKLGRRGDDRGLRGARGSPRRPGWCSSPGRCGRSRRSSSTAGSVAGVLAGASGGGRRSAAGPRAGQVRRVRVDRPGRAARGVQYHRRAALAPLRAERRRNRRPTHRRLRRLTSFEDSLGRQPRPSAREANGRARHGYRAVTTLPGSGHSVAAPMNLKGRRMNRPVRAAAALSLVLTLLVAVAVSRPVGARNRAELRLRAAAASRSPCSRTRSTCSTTTGVTREPVTAAFNLARQSTATPGEHRVRRGPRRRVTQDGLQNQVEPGRSPRTRSWTARSCRTACWPATTTSTRARTTRRPGRRSRRRSARSASRAACRRTSARPPTATTPRTSFTAGGRRWLVLALDWRLSPAGTTWARGILDANKTVPTIVTTHETLNRAGADGTASLVLRQHAVERT